MVNLTLEPKVSIPTLNNPSTRAILDGVLMKARIKRITLHPRLIKRGGRGVNCMIIHSSLEFIIMPFTRPMTQ